TAPTSPTVTTRRSGKRRVGPEIRAQPLDVGLAVVGATVATATPAGSIAEAAVLVADGRIVYAGPQAAAPPYTAHELIDARGKWIFPGLVNTHTPAWQSTVRNTPSIRRL